MATGPTVQARTLGTRLAELRTKAKITQRAAAEHARISQGHLSNVEAGRTIPDPGVALVLVCHYKATDQEIEEVKRLLQGASQRGWWNIYKLPRQLEYYVGLEADALHLRTLDIILVTGIAQTEAYARKLHQLRGLYTREEVERRVAVRMQRKQRLIDGSLQLTAVLDEAALRRCANEEPELAEDQLRHLHDLGQLPNVEIRILPFGLGLHVGTGGAFSILTFPDGAWQLPDVAYQEYIVGGHIIDDQSAVSQLDTLFSELRTGHALDVNDSLALLAEFADSIR